MNPLKFGLIGCGNIARKHAQVLHEYLEEGKIGAFVDRDLRRAQDFSAKYGAPAYSSVSDMMSAQGDQIDVFSVLTPSGSHCANVLELVQYGRPIVVEKPMALRLEDADRMIEACDANGVKLFVVHQNRYNAPIVQAREALQQGRFGRLVMGTIRLRWTRDQAYYDSESWRGTWAHDGGVFMNQAVHHIDMLTWFMGNVDSMRSMSATRWSTSSARIPASRSSDSTPARWACWRRRRRRGRRISRARSASSARKARWSSAASS